MKSTELKAEDMPTVSPSRTLYLIACGAPPARDAHVLVELAQAQNWRVIVLSTPSGRSFLRTDAIERLTGLPVRSEYRQPDDCIAESLPDPDAIVVAPATFNSINKLASGIADTYALGVVSEAIGAGARTVIAPFLNTALARHPVFDRSVAILRGFGVHVVYAANVAELPRPGSGGRGVVFPWAQALDAASG